MADQHLIHDYRQGQEHYSQARYFTPGHQMSDVTLARQGLSRTMDLLVVVHNDVPGAVDGIHVDVQADATPGGTRRTGPGQGSPYQNVHAVNTYDAQTGITDHTAMYSRADLDRIQNVSPGHTTADREPSSRFRAVPGATVYSVTAQMKNVNGQLVIDMDQPLQAGPGASRYSLHDQQDSMDWAAADHGKLSVAQQLAADAKAVSTGSPLTPVDMLTPSSSQQGARFNPRARVPIDSPADVGTTATIAAPGLARSAVQPAKRHLPGQKVVDAKNTRGFEPAIPLDKKSVTKAATQGFANGFIGGLMNKRKDVHTGVDAAGVATAAPASSAASAVSGNPALSMPVPPPLASMASLADQVEQSELSALPSAADLDERMERFPELRDVMVPTGNAARFPELAEQPAPSASAQAAQSEQTNGDYAR